MRNFCSGTTVVLGMMHRDLGARCGLLIGGMKIEIPKLISVRDRREECKKGGMCARNFVYIPRFGDCMLT